VTEWPSPDHVPDRLAEIALGGGLAVGVSLLLSPVVRRIALRYGFNDRLLSHQHPPVKPRLGGVALVLAVVLAVIGTWPLFPERTPEEAGKLLGLMGGTLVLLVLGTVDDRRPLGAGVQFGGQFAAASLAIAGGVVIGPVSNPLGTPLTDSMLDLPPWIAVALTYLWLLGAMNAVNFLDGLDGLAAGVIGIAALVLSLHSYLLGQYTITLLAVALAAAAAGFLPFNTAPARLTLGTSGSLFLGFFAGALAIVGGAKVASALMVLGVPILDAAWIIVFRIMKGRSPFLGDRAHLHHRLLDLGLGHRRIVFLFYAVTALAGGLALLVPSRLPKLYLLALLGVAGLGGLIAVAHRPRAEGRAPR